MADLLGFFKMFTSGAAHGASADSQREVLSGLKFIGQISPHEKIDSAELQVESKSFWTPIKRFFVTGDSRKSTLHFFSSTIDRSFEILMARLHSQNISEQIFCANILQDLLNSVKGLQATKKTYMEDKRFCCEIDVLLEIIQCKILEIQKTHNHLFTIKEACILDLSNAKKTTLPPRLPSPDDVDDSRSGDHVKPPIVNSAILQKISEGAAEEDEDD